MKMESFVALRLLRSSLPASRVALLLRLRVRIGFCRHIRARHGAVP
ncbi:MAG: hypothetical protein P8127_03470 [Acidobacteriota bacterium]